MALELKEIGEFTYRGNTPISAQTKKHLNAGLFRLFAAYDDTLGKSKERKQQTRALKQRLSERLTHDAPDDNHTAYTDIMDILHAAKCAAITQDNMKNQRSFFKQNRKGYSRYYNTLNQMSSLVLQQWSQDPSQQTNFANYLHISEQQTREMAEKLCATLRQAIGLRKLKPSIKALYEQFELVSTRIVNDRWNVQNLQEFLNEARLMNPKLDSYIQNLVRELEQSIQVQLQYLEDHEYHEPLQLLVGP